MNILNRQAARYATTAWELHWVSLMTIRDQLIHGHIYVTRSASEAEVLCQGRLALRHLVVNGWDVSKREHTTLHVICTKTAIPQNQIGPTIKSYLSPKASGSHTYDDAFNVWAWSILSDFSFVADAVAVTPKGPKGTPLGGMFRNQGWTAIAGVREGSGRIHSLSLPKPDNFPYL